MLYGTEEDIPHALDGVTEDDFLVRVSFRVVVSAMVNELHLFQNGGFARLASAEEKHLDLILGHKTITLKLGLDLVVP